LYVEDKKYHNVSETGSVSVLRWMGQDKATYKTMDKVQNKPNSYVQVKECYNQNIIVSIRNQVPL
jgi:hypothetical protein